MIFNSNKKDINSHDVLADLFEGKNVKQAMKAAKSVSFNSEIEKFLAEALICLREITGEKNPVLCDRKINSKNGDILLNRAFDWFETARKSAKTGSDEEMSLVREIMFSEYVLICFIMGAYENKCHCLYSIVYGINSRQQGNQQSFNDSFFEKAFAGAGDVGVSEEILRAYREELRDATAVSNSQGAAEVKTVTVNQGGGKDSSEAKMIFEEDCFQNENNLSTAQNTTIAAADRNNKEKDASNKSEPQGEFKRIEIDGDLFEGYFINGKKNGAENTPGQTATSMTECGRTTKDAAGEESVGQTERHLTVNGTTVKSTAAEPTPGQTAISLTVTGWMTSAPAKEESHGQAESHLTVNGRTIRCPKENTPSRTAKNMKGSGTTVKSTAAEPTPGQTATPMRVIGGTTNAAAGANSSNTANPRAVKHI